MSKQKTVIKLGVPNDKSRSKAMQLASKFIGVNSVAIAGDAKDRLEVSGESIDIAGLINKLRKNVCRADIVVVENKVEEEAKKKKEEEDKKKKAEEEKKKAEEAKKKAEEARKKAEEDCKKLWGEAYPYPPPPRYYGDYYYNHYRPAPPTAFLCEHQAQPEASCHIM